jgi:hypothetical protein
MRSAAPERIPPLLLMSFPTEFSVDFIARPAPRLISGGENLIEAHMRRIFEVGDVVSYLDDKTGRQRRAQIMVIRHSGSDASLGVDLLCEDGQVRFERMQDIARENPEQLNKLRGATPSEF